MIKGTHTIAKNIETVDVSKPLKLAKKIRREDIPIIPPFDQGRICNHIGMSRKENPYDNGTNLWRLWNNGFDQHDTLKGREKDLAFKQACILRFSK